MTTLKCIIVDDEPLAIRLLKAHVEQVPELELCGTFEQAVKALAFLRQQSVDLVFLDIQMPAITGLEFARTLPEQTRIIFTTAYRDYAVESFEFNVLDYLVKPIIFARFYRAVGKALLPVPTSAPIGYAQGPPAAAPEKTVAAASVTYRYFNVNKKHVRINLEDITYVESVKDYLKIHTTKKTITTRAKISEFASTLPPYFLRTHRSFLVNLHHVTAYTAHDVEVGNAEIPIGISYKSEVMKRLAAA